MRVVQEFQAAGRVIGGGGGHRVDGDGRLTSLELVDRADPDPGGTVGPGQPD